MSDHDAVGVRNASPTARSDKKEVSNSKAEFIQLGAVGWELVTTIEYTGGGMKFLLFKRPADKDEFV